MEQLVLLGVGVPEELPLNLGELDVLAVELGDDLRGPLFLKQTELLGERNGVHDRKVGGGLCLGGSATFGAVRSAGKSTRSC